MFLKRRALGDPTFQLRDFRFSDFRVGRWGWHLFVGVLGNQSLPGCITIKISVTKCLANPVGDIQSQVRLALLFGRTMAMVTV